MSRSTPMLPQHSEREWGRIGGRTGPARGDPLGSPPAPVIGEGREGEPTPPTRYLGLFVAAGSDEPSKRVLSGYLRYARQQVAIDVMGYNAVRFCLRRRIDRHMELHTLYHSSRQQRARLSGLMTCHQVWVCPVCGQRISEGRRAEVEEAIINHRLGGGTVLFLTHTVSHGPQTELRSLLDTTLKAYTALTRERGYKRLMAAAGQVGSIKALESTWGASNGFHPHLHALVFLRAHVDAESVRERIFPVWERVAARHGLTMSERRGLAVQETRGGIADYFAKWGVVPRDGQAWGPESELTRWTSKRGAGQGDERRYQPFEFLDEYAITRDRTWALRFRDYAAAFRRRRQLRWSPGLRAQLLAAPGEESDEELAGRADGDEIVMGSVLAERYRRVVVTRQIKQFFAAAATGDMGAVEAVLAEADRIVGERIAEGEDTHEDIF